MKSKAMLYGIVGVIVLLALRAFSNMRIGQNVIAPSKVRVPNGFLDIIGSPAPQGAGVLAPANRSLDSPLQMIAISYPTVNPGGDPGRTLDPGFGGFGEGESSPGFEVS